MEKSTIEKSVDYIKNKTRPEQDAKAMADDALCRAQSHVSGVEDRVDELPALIKAAEDKVLEFISQGRGTANAEREAGQLQDELTVKEKFLDKTAEEFTKKNLLYLKRTRYGN